MVSASLPIAWTEGQIRELVLSGWAVRRRRAGASEETLSRLSLDRSRGELEEVRAERRVRENRSWSDVVVKNHGFDAVCLSSRNSPPSPQSVP